MESNIENPFLTKHNQLLIVKLSLVLAVDVLSALLVVTLFTYRSEFITGYLPLMSLLFMCLFPCVIMFVKWKHVNQLILYSLLLLMLAAGIYVFSVSWLLLSVLLIFIHWRFVTHFQSEETYIEINSGLVLGYVFVSIASITFGSIRDLGNEHIIYCLLFLFLSIIAAGTAVHRMMNVQNSTSKRNKHIFKPFVILATVVISGAGLAFFSPFVRTGFYWIVHNIFWVLSFLVDPLFHLLLKIRDWLMSLISRDTLDGTGLKLNKPEFDSEQQNAFYEGVSIPWLKEIMIVLFILAAIIYVLKKRKVTLEACEDVAETSLFTTYQTAGTQKDEQTFSIVYSDASNTIRKYMKKLEREASFANLGRNANENIRTWFTRLGILEDEAFFTLYEGVRYGMNEPGHEEIDYFICQIDLHIEELKNKQNMKDQ